MTMCVDVSGVVDAMGEKESNSKLEIKSFAKVMPSKDE